MAEMVPHSELVVSRDCRITVTCTASLMGDPAQIRLARDASYLGTSRDDSVVDLMTALPPFFRL
jgi:hypothetical protein